MDNNKNTELAKGKIYGVSLGPGDPELITVKGLRILNEVDKIYYPGSQLKNNKRESYSLTILEQLSINPAKLEGFFLEMSTDRLVAKQVYAQTFEKIKEDVNLGKTVAIVSEGDISFYSSFAYLLEKIKEVGMPVELITGASSILTAAALAQIPLSLQNEKIVIIPRVNNTQQLEQYLVDFNTVVLIKIKSVIRSIISVLEKQALQFVYCERLGTAEEYSTTNLQELKKREVPYFSLMIIKK